MSFDAHECFSFDSFEQQLLFWDDFEGDALKDLWNLTGTGSAPVVDAQTGGIVRITTGGTTGNSFLLDWGDTRSLHADQKAVIEARVKLSSISDITAIISLRFDANNRVRFWFKDSLHTNWMIQNIDGGVGVALDSGIVPDTDYHIFRIEFESDGVHYYIDETEVTNSPIATNVPDDGGDFLQPWLYCDTEADAVKSVDVDYCYLRQERG